MQTREGRAAQLVPESGQERLVIPHDTAFPRGDFTIEAFVNVKSAYPTSAVRTIASKWDGNKGHPGWSLGVTGAGSRNKPQTLVLQLCGDKPWKSTDPIEPVFSGLHIDIGKPYFIAVTVNLGDTTEKGITFTRRISRTTTSPCSPCRSRTPSPAASRTKRRSSSADSAREMATSSTD